MLKVKTDSFADLGDSKWIKYQTKIFNLPIVHDNNSDIISYDPNISQELGNRAIEIIKDGSIVELLDQNKKYIISTVQEPISPKGSFPYHENVNVFDQLYNKCVECNIDPYNILYISGDRFVDEFNTTPVKSIFVPGWNHLFWGENVQNKIDLDARQYKHTFLSFNRIHKPHRMYFINRLLQLDLLDNNLVSCAKIIDGENYLEHFRWIENDLHNHGSNYDPHGLLNIQEQKQIAERIQAKLPLVLDVADFQENGCYESDTFWTSLPFYQNSFMSVITESNAVGPGCYISEAIFRPFVFLQPFLTVAQPRTLQVLREWGFDVFDDVFDNSYDTEPDMFLRTEMVLKEIQRFSSYSEQQLKDITHSIKDRLQYNQNLYFSAEFKQKTRSYLEEMVQWIDANTKT